MDTLGQILKSTRERKRISLSQAAVKTRIKLQHLEMMERDDFSKMPAPAYAKGFLRMYADFLGLDAAPLVQEYVQKHLRREAGSAPPPPAPPPVREQGRPPPPPPPGQAAPAEVEPQPASGTPSPRSVLTGLLKPVPLHKIWPVVLVLLVVWLLATGLSRCGRDTEQGRPTAFRKGTPAVIEEPAEPYLDVSKPGSEAR